MDEVSGKEILDLVRRQHALDKARQLAESYVHRAKSCLEPLPSSTHKESLLTLADYVIDRSS